MNKRPFKKIHSFFSLLFFLFSATVADAALPKVAWPIWVINNPLSEQVISHDLWEQFLEHNVVTNNEIINLIDYAHVSKKDRAALNDYIIQMSHVNIDQYNRSEQLAFWINLYNALIVQTVIHYYPVTTVQEIRISPGVFNLGPWSANLITVKGIPLSLDDIKNRIIRPIWNDQRTLYALNNASIGAPNIGKHAYTGLHLEELLNEAATNYINSLRGVHVIEGKLIISKIYDWYEEDFGGTKHDVIQHITLFAKEPLLSQLKHINTVDSYTYNWHLNLPPG